MKFTKTNIMDINITKHEVESHLDFMLFFKIKINDFKEEEFKLSVIDALDISWADDFLYTDGTELDVLEDIPNLYLICDTEQEFIDMVQPLIKQYLIINKIPNIYCDIDEDTDEDCEYHECRTASLRLEELLTTNDTAKYIQKGRSISNTFTYTIYNNILEINNIHLSKKYNLSSTDLLVIDKYILEYNKEWNSIIDGKFIWE